MIQVYALCSSASGLVTDIMSIATLVSLQEYPGHGLPSDRDYVDGVLLDAMWDKKIIASCKARSSPGFGSRRQELRLAAFPEQRIQVRSTRYRRAGCLRRAAAEPIEQILLAPLHLR